MASINIGDIIGFLLPLVLVIIFVISFSIKVETDQCNIKYIQCKPAVPDIEPATTNPETTEASTTTNPETTKPSTPTDTTTTKPTTTKPTTTKPTTTKPAKALDMSGYKKGAIGLLSISAVLLLVLLLTTFVLPLSTSLINGDEAKDMFKILLGIGSVPIIACIAGSAYLLSKGNIFAGFAVSFIAFTLTILYIVFLIAGEYRAITIIVGGIMLFILAIISIVYAVQKKNHFTDILDNEPLDFQKANELVSTENSHKSTENFADTLQVKCPGYETKPIPPDSEEYINGFSTATYVFVAIAVIAIGIISWLKKGDIMGSSKKDNIPNAIIAVIALVLCVVALVKSATGKNGFDKYLGFILAILAIVAVVGKSLHLFGKLSFSTTTTGGATEIEWTNIAGIVSVPLFIIITTIILLTTQKDNLRKNLVKYAVNNAVADSTAVLCGVGAIVWLLGSFSLFKNWRLKGTSVAFGVCLLITAILLIACVAIYFDYKKQCSRVSVICKPKLIDPSIDENTNYLSNVGCFPNSTLEITPNKVKDLSIAIPVLMTLTTIGTIVCAKYMPNNFF